MKYTDVYKIMYKTAGWQDVAAVAAPGLATAGSLYWLSKYVPGLRKSRLARGVVAGLGGAGASYLMNRYIGNRTQAAKQRGQELASNQHAKEMNDVSSQLKGIAGKLGLNTEGWDNSTMASNLSDMRIALNNAKPVNVQHLTWDDLNILDSYLNDQPAILNKIKGQNNFVMPFMNKSIYDTTPRTISKGNASPFTPEQREVLGVYLSNRPDYLDKIYSMEAIANPGIENPAKVIPVGQ